MTNKIKTHKELAKLEQQMRRNSQASVLHYQQTYPTIHVPENVSFEAPIKVLEFDADNERLQRILGNYDEFASLSMQDMHKLLGVEKQPLALTPAKQFDRSLHEFPAKILPPKNLYPDKPDVAKVINISVNMQNKYKLLGAEKHPLNLIPAKQFDRSLHECPAKILLPKNLPHDKPNIAKVISNSVTQHDDRAPDIPISTSSFIGSKIHKRMPVSNDGSTASVLVETASNVNNYSKHYQQFSQVTSNKNNAAVKTEPDNVFTPQFKTPISTISSRQPVPQHMKEMCDLSKPVLKKTLSHKFSDYSFGKIVSRCVFLKKETNGSCVAVNGVQFKDKPKPQLLKQKIERNSFSGTSALEMFDQSPLDTDVKRSNDFMSDESPLLSDQQEQSTSLFKDKSSQHVPGKNSGSLQSELDSALRNNITFSDDREDICVDDLLDEIIEFTSIDQPISPIPNSPTQDIPTKDSSEQFIEVLSRDKPVSPIHNASIDNSLKVRESVQSLTQEVSTQVSVGKPIPFNRGISTQVIQGVNVKIDLNLFAGMLCIDKQSPYFLNPLEIKTKVINTLTPEESVVHQCVSEKPMENSGSDEINENLFREQDALKLEKPVSNSYKAVSDSNKVVSDSHKSVSDSLLHSGIVTKKRKLSVMQYLEAVKRQKISLDSRPRHLCTDFPKMLLNPDDCHVQATKYKHQADSMEHSIRKYVLYVEAVLWYLKCGYAMEKSKTPRINEAVSMYIETNKFVTYQYQQIQAFQDKDKTRNTKLKLIVLCLWIRSFVCFKMAMLKKTETIALKQALDDLKQGGDQTSSKAVSAWQVKFKVPYNLHSIRQQIATNDRYLSQGHLLWSQANDAITKDGIKEFFQEIDKTNEALTIHSGLGNMINYVKTAITSLGV